MCNQAATAIETPAATRKDTAAAVPGLTALLRRTDTTAAALKALRALVRAGVRVDAAVPALLERAMVPDGPARVDPPPRGSGWSH